MLEDVGVGFVFSFPFGNGGYLQGTAVPGVLSGLIWKPGRF